MITAFILLSVFLLLRSTVCTALMVALAAEYLALLIGSFAGTWFTLNSLFAVAVALSVVLLLRARGKLRTSWPESLSHIAESRALQILVVANIVIVVMTLMRGGMAWDEYSHWGHTIKYLTSMGRLPDALHPPIGHGAPWYPWGLGIYGVALSFPFSGISLNAPLVINSILLVLVSCKAAGLLGLDAKKRALAILLLYVLLGVTCGPSWLTGYADFSLSMTGIICLLYLYGIIDSFTKADAKYRFDEVLGFFASLIVLISLKESGKYLATLVLISSPPMVIAYRRATPLKNVLPLIGAAYIAAMALTVLWSFKSAQFSAHTSREVGLFLHENLAATKMFFAAALSDIWKSHHLYRPFLVLELIALFAGRRGQKFAAAQAPKALADSLITSFYCLALLNGLFVVAAFYLTFSVGEFKVAASCSRYLEFSAACLVVAAAMKLWFRYRWQPGRLAHNVLISVLCLALISFIHGAWKDLRNEDSHLQLFVQKLDGRLRPEEVITFVDFATSGYYPIKINFFLKSPMPLYYGVVALGQKAEIPPMWMARSEITRVMVVDLKANLSCYKQVTNYESVEDDGALIYLFVDKAHIQDFVDRRSCSQS